MANFTLNTNAGGESIGTPIQVTVTDGDGKNYGRASKSQGYTIKTYQEEARTTVLQSRNFTVTHKPAAYQILIADVTQTDPSSSAALFTGLTKVIPTASTQIPKSGGTAASYYVYGLTNARYLYYTGSNVTFGAFKYSNTAGSWQQSSFDETKAGPATDSYGQADTYYFYFQVNASGASSFKLWAGSTEAGSGNVYTVTTTASGTITFTPISVSIPAIGGDTSVNVSNTTGYDVSVASSGHTFFSPVSGSVTAGTSANFAIAGTSPNYDKVLIGSKYFLQYPTSAAKSGSITATGSGSPVTCNVSQAASSIDMSTSVLSINGGQGVLMNTPNVQNVVSYISLGKISGDSTGVPVWVRLVSISNGFSASIDRASNTISFMADGNAFSGTAVFEWCGVNSGGTPIDWSTGYSSYYRSTTVNLTYAEIITNKPILSIDPQRSSFEVSGSNIDFTIQFEWDTASPTADAQTEFAQALNSGKILIYRTDTEQDAALDSADATNMIAHYTTNGMWNQNIPVRISYNDANLSYFDIDGGTVAIPHTGD